MNRTQSFRRKLLFFLTFQLAITVTDVFSNDIITFLDNRNGVTHIGKTLEGPTVTQCKELADKNTEFVEEEYNTKGGKSNFLDLPISKGLVKHINKFFKKNFGDYKGSELTFGSSNDNSFHGALDKILNLKKGNKLKGDDTGKTFGLFIEHIAKYKKKDKESQVAIKFYTDLYSKLARVKNGPFSNSKDPTGRYYQSAKSVEGVDFDIVKGLSGKSYLRLKVGVGREKHGKNGYAAKIQETWHQLTDSLLYNNLAQEKDKKFLDGRFGYGRIIRWNNSKNSPTTKIEAGVNVSTLKKQNYGYARAITKAPIGKRLKLVSDTTLRSNEHITTKAKAELRLTKNTKLWAGANYDRNDPRNKASKEEITYTIGMTYLFGKEAKSASRKYTDPRKYKKVTEHIYLSHKKKKNLVTVKYQVNEYICILKTKKIMALKNTTVFTSQMPSHFDYKKTFYKPSGSRPKSACK